MHTVTLSIAMQVLRMSTRYTMFGSAVFAMSLMLFAVYIFLEQFTHEPSIDDVNVESLAAEHVIPDMALTINLSPAVSVGQALKYFWPVPPLLCRFVYSSSTTWCNTSPPAQGLHLERALQRND